MGFPVVGVNIIQRLEIPREPNVVDLSIETEVALLSHESEKTHQWLTAVHCTVLEGFTHSRQ